MLDFSFTRNASSIYDFEEVTLDQFSSYVVLTTPVYGLLLLRWYLFGPI